MDELTPCRCVPRVLRSSALPLGGPGVWGRVAPHKGHHVGALQSPFLAMSFDLAAVWSSPRSCGARGHGRPSVARTPIRALLSKSGGHAPPASIARRETFASSAARAGGPVAPTGPRSGPALDLYKGYK
jgi:hypothetical protein